MMPETRSPTVNMAISTTWRFVGLAIDIDACSMCISGVVPGYANISILANKKRPVGTLRCGGLVDIEPVV